MKKYKTCVSIAEDTPAKIKKMLLAALEESDYAEVRFDFLKINQIPDALEIIKKHLKRVVCTLRPDTEGGRFRGDETQRIAVLKLIAEYNPFLLDVEFNTLKNNAPLVTYLKSTGTVLLVSWHDFKKTPGPSELDRKLRQMSRFSSYLKVVTTAKKIDDSTRMLELYAKKGENTLISFAMGDLGRISRILCLYLGSPYTYVSLGKAVAPGQFSIGEIKRIINLKGSAN